MKKETLKNIAYFIGKSLGILGLLFVFYKLYQEYTFSSFTEQFLLLIPTLPLLLLLNIFSLLIGIYVWYILLLNYATKSFPFLASYYYFAKTDIAKYLPGNIFHYVGRQALASKLNISQIQMGKISILNILLLVTGTILASTIFAFLAQETPPLILTLMGISSIISLIILVYMYSSFPVRKKMSMDIYIAISITLQGIMLGFIVMYQSEYFTLSLFVQCAGIYTLSWLIGFVTPGASGGLGVREGVFIAATAYLNIDIAEEIIIFSVLFIRLINIVVDVILYLTTFTLENKMKELKL